jgi:WD40 repeat protein
MIVFSKLYKIRYYKITNDERKYLRKHCSFMLERIINFDHDGSAKLSPNKELMIVSMYNGITKVYNIQTGHLLGTFDGHEYCVAFNLNQSEIITSSENGTTKIWDTKGHLLRKFGEQINKPVSCIALSGDQS